MNAGALWVSLLLPLVPVGRAVAAEPLPEGDEGIAASHPGDVGIDADPQVIFADDFEAHASVDALVDTWDAVYQLDQIRLATEPDHVFSGSQALEFTVPQQDDELSNATDKVVSPELDVLFLRYYSRFEAPFDVVGSSHNGAMISAHYFIDGQATPGVPADGTNKFLAALENWRGEPETASPGLLNVYIYHPEQRSQWGDHFFPTGVVLPNSSDPFDFGPDFVERPDIIPELDRWYCWEAMVQANTPGQPDGRIAAWLDGVLVADFQNLRLRDVDTLTIDRFGLSFHIGSNSSGETRKWYDNVVAAHSYIGPMYEAEAGDTGGADETGGGSASGGSDSTQGAGGSASGGDDMGPGSGGTSSPAGDDGSGDAGCGCRTKGTGPGASMLVRALLGWVRPRRWSREP